MPLLTEASILSERGRFREALDTLDSGGLPSGKDRIVANVLRAELLEHVGRHAQSRALAESLLRSEKLSSVQKSRCECVIGRIDWENGSTDSSLVHLQRAVTLASEAGDLERTCWSQLLLLMSLAGRSGPDSVTPLLAQIRAN